jgi:hypothetical protein
MLLIGWQTAWLGFVWTWLLAMAILTAVMAVLGHGITGIARGALIDRRNRLSLSRLQMLAWSVIILAGLYTAVMANLHLNDADPLQITLSKELWAALGISTASLVGSPLIKTNKQERHVEPARAEQILKTLNLRLSRGETQNPVEASGQLVSNQNPEDSRLADLFMGEDLGDAALVDLGKAQMFFFTIVILVSYGAALMGFFDAHKGLFRELPELSQSVVALMGISHAGYLVKKAAPKSPTA